MERVKVDGVRTRPKNKLDPSKDNSFSTVRGTRLGGSCVSGLIVCYNYSENLRGVGRDKKKEGETETKFFSLTYV